ncbi:hypothetical protein BKA70DRAFT_1222330 [Coprinopsis sp. MPI-PUGE-AT-0042]|nr:hypothetical protein BKA70DRAFT_1222330 [Coprinopsis sp. MPI-PUGE-AT-0042]
MPEKEWVGWTGKLKDNAGSCAYGEGGKGMERERKPCRSRMPLREEVCGKERPLDHSNGSLPRHANAAFMHEVLRCSRTSEGVCQAASRHLEAIRPNLTDLIRHEKEAKVEAEACPSASIDIVQIDEATSSLVHSAQPGVKIHAGRVLLELCLGGILCSWWRSWLSIGLSSRSEATAFISFLTPHRRILCVRLPPSTRSLSHTLSLDYEWKQQRYSMDTVDFPSYMGPVFGAYLQYPPTSPNFATGLDLAQTSTSRIFAPTNLTGLMDVYTYTVLQASARKAARVAAAALSDDEDEDEDEDFHSNKARREIRKKRIELEQHHCGELHDGCTRLKENLPRLPRRQQSPIFSTYRPPYLVLRRCPHPAREEAAPR